MTDVTKSLIKSTILGLLGGGAISAMYSAKDNSKESPSDTRSNEINVPLSRRQFMKAVRPRSSKDSKSEERPSKEEPQKDLSKMTPQEIAAYKKALLRSKTASDASCKGGNTCITVPMLEEKPIRRIAGAGSTYPRDDKGRFVAEDSVEKKALFDGVISDAAATALGGAGFIGGGIAGMAAIKLISDRIRINKRKKQVEAARQRYADALAAEVNDEDLPYYSKTAEDKRGLPGSILGLLGLAGVTAGTAAGVVAYRIMENRRKAAEKAKDKDLANYPLDKSVRFSFPKVAEARDDFFV